MKKLLTICFVAVFMLAASSAVQSATLEVRPPGGTGALGDVYTSIQQAIDEASPGDTINVAAGTYEDDTVGPDGHLVINTANLTLKSSAGKDSTTINVANGVGIDIQAGASGVVLGGGTGSGFTIAGGTDTSFVIQLVSGPSGVEISHNAIDSTGNASMGVSVGVAGAADLTISDNDFTADGSDGSIWAPRVVDFTVSDNTFDGGAYAIQTNGVTTNSQSLISGNEITNPTGSGGIVIGNGEGTSDLAITGNTITGCVHGIYLAEYCAQGTPGDMTTVTVEDNTLSANDKGIRITDGAHVLASNFTIQDNCITGNTTYGLQNQHTSELVNAELNAWGDADGPYHPDTNPHTSGDQVSDNVDYYQWYPDCNFTTPVYKPVHNVTLDRYYDTIQDAIDDAGDGDTITADVQTYNESVTIDVDNLTLSGIEGSLPSITGGVALVGVTGLTLENFVITGNGGSNSVIRMTGAVTDLTLDNCVVDGEDVSGRNGITGGQLEGDVTITNCELKNLLGWAVLDSRSGSGGDGSAMDTVTFAGNNIHHCNGSIVFRGLSSDRTDVVNAYGNTWNNIGGNNAEQGEHWAALEINRTVDANVYDNDVNGVAEGQWGEGQALQLWDIDTLDVHDNTFTDNFQGIQVYGEAFGDTFAVPGGSIYCNTISGNSDFGINVDPCATGGPLNAENNWWGDVNGPSGEGPGSGDAVSTNVDYFPWLLSEDCNDSAEVVADFVVDDDWALELPFTQVFVDSTAYYIGLNAFAVIQDAVDAASDGNSIYVQDGTYDPFTVDGKTDLTITSASTVTVEGVQSVTTAYTDRDCVVFVKDSVNVVLQDLNIEGNGLGTINTKSYGVIYENSSGHAKDCNVSPNTIGDMSGIGIGIWDGSEVKVDPTLVQNFGRIGIFIYNGCDVEVLDSEIIGQVYNDGNLVNYGIEVEGGWGSDDPATASRVTIKRNAIYNCDNTDTEVKWGSSAILINGWLEYMAAADSTVTVVDNDIYDNYNGIYAIKSPNSRATLNNILGNRTTGVESAPAHDSSTAVFDAEYNWWGDVSGPNDPCGTTETDGTSCPDVSEIKNDDGLGDRVSENAIYCAWLTAPACTSTLPCLAGDLNFDGCVNWLDVAILADRWLEGCEE